MLPDRSRLGAGAEGQRKPQRAHEASCIEMQDPFPLLPLDSVKHRVGNGRYFGQLETITLAGLTLSFRGRASHASGSQ